MDRGRTLAAPVLLLLWCAAPAGAYLPYLDVPGRARSDLSKAEAIVIGRVTKIERLKEIAKSQHGESHGFGYWATITVGEAIRGPVEKGDEMLVCIGCYVQKEEDNTRPTELRMYGSHRRIGLRINGVYLLFLDRCRIPPAAKEAYEAGRLVPGERAREVLAQGNMWEPRSCHASVHELVLVKDARGEIVGVGVREGQWRGEPKAPVPLAEFLAMKKRQAEEEEEKERERPAPAPPPEAR